MFFRIKKNAGNHTQLNDKGVSTIYKAGDTIKSDADLVKCFPRKFERLDTDDTVKLNLAPGIPMSSAVASANATSLDTEIPKTHKDGIIEELGEDITEQYELPTDKNVKIYTKGGGWCTIRIDDDPQQDEKLRMNAIQAWINLAS